MTHMQRVALAVLIVSQEVLTRHQDDWLGAVAAGLSVLAFLLFIFLPRDN